MSLYKSGLETNLTRNSAVRVARVAGLDSVREAALPMAGILIVGGLVTMVLKNRVEGRRESDYRNRLMAMRRF